PFFSKSPYDNPAGPTDGSGGIVLTQQSQKRPRVRENGGPTSKLPARGKGGSGRQSLGPARTCESGVGGKYQRCSWVRTRRPGMDSSCCPREYRRRDFFIGCEASHRFFRS